MNTNTSKPTCPSALVEVLRTWEEDGYGHQEVKLTMANADWGRINQTGIMAYQHVVDLAGVSPIDLRTIELPGKGFTGSSYSLTIEGMTNSELEHQRVEFEQELEHKQQEHLTKGAILLVSTATQCLSCGSIKHQLRLGCGCEDMTNPDTTINIVHGGLVREKSLPADESEFWPMDRLLEAHDAGRGILDWFSLEPVSVES